MVAFAVPAVDPCRSQTRSFRQHLECIFRLIWLGLYSLIKLIPSRGALSFLTIAFVLIPASWSSAQQPASQSPLELVRRAVANEMRSTDQGSKYMFRQHKETPAGSQTRLLVQTR